MCEINGLETNLKSEPNSFTESFLIKFILFLFSKFLAWPILDKSFFIFNVNCKSRFAFFISGSIDIACLKQVSASFNLWESSSSIVPKLL